MASLRIDDYERDKPRVNDWIARIEGQLSTLEALIDNVNTSQSDTATTVASSEADSAVPTAVSAQSATESGYITDGNLWSEVTFQYTAPSPLDSFHGIFVVAKDYRGNAELVKIWEHTYTGAAGGTVSFPVTLQRTGETVTFFFVAKTATGVADADWGSAPSATAALDGNASAPSTPSGLTSTKQALGNMLAWTANSEGNLQGYIVYRHTADTFGSSSKIAEIATTRAGSPFFFDNEPDTETQYFYWVTAVNSAGQESTESSSATNTTTDILTVNASDEIGIGGVPVAGNSISIAGGPVVRDDGTYDASLYHKSALRDEATTFHSGNTSTTGSFITVASFTFTKPEGVTQYKGPLVVTALMTDATTWTVRGRIRITGAGSVNSNEITVVNPATSDSGTVTASGLTTGKALITISVQVHLTHNGTPGANDGQSSFTQTEYTDQGDIHA